MLTSLSPLNALSQPDKERSPWAAYEVDQRADIKSSSTFGESYKSTANGLPAAAIIKIDSNEATAACKLKDILLNQQSNIQPTKHETTATLSFVELHAKFILLS